VDAKIAAVDADQEPRRIADAAFKTVEAEAPPEIATPPIRLGRILPSLESATSPSEPLDAEASNGTEKSRVARKRKVRDVRPAGRVRAPEAEARATKSKAKRAGTPPKTTPTPIVVRPHAPRDEAAADLAAASALPPSGRSKRAIVGRYVLRDENQPGQIWKRKLLARRDSRT
jgi:hypothetical protein